MPFLVAQKHYEAAAMIYCTLRAWQDWEAGKRRMHPAFWELWHVKAITLPDQTPQSDEAIEHDPWFRAQVAQGLDEADAPSTQWVPHEDAQASWASKRTDLMTRARSASQPDQDNT